MAIYKKISNDEYNSMEGLRATILKEMVKSPLHAKYALDNPKKPTESLQFGRWLHSYLLEKEDFEKNHFLLDKKLDLRKTADKDFKAKMQEQFGDNIIDLESAELLKSMRQSALSNPAVSALLKSVSDVELSLDWVENGVKCKARLDAINRQKKAIIDIKTCQDASLAAFSRSLYKYGYHLQASHYLEAAIRNNIDVDSFLIVPIEKDPPHAAACYMLDLGSLGVAQVQRESLLSMFLKCQQSNKWPSYSDKVEEIALPEYASSEIEKSFLKGE